MLGALATSLLLSLVHVPTTARERFVVINNETGVDIVNCLKQNTTSPCKTLSYVLNNGPSLNNSEVIFFGDQLINETLIIFHVENLTIRGASKTDCVLKCVPSSHSNKLGSGLLIISAVKLSIFNIVFEGCGSSQFSTIISKYGVLKYYSAVYIINSTDIQLIATRFYRNTGRALSMHDVNGQVQISNSTFVENEFRNDESALFGGGSIYIEFTYCSPGNTRCDPEANNHNTNSSYLINDCTFKGNRVSSKIATEENNVHVRISNERYEGHAGHGGGIYISMRGVSFNNSLTVENCTFVGNSAVRGGAISALFHNRASHNFLYVNWCTFKENHASLTSGGALLLSFYSVGGEIANNSISIQNTNFIGNSAEFGGAVSFFTSRTRSNQNNSLSFTNCSFVENSASAGGAVYLTPLGQTSVYDCSSPTVVFCNCSFVKNEVPIRHISFGNSQHALESGVLSVDSLQVDLLTNVSFVENRGSAVFAASVDIRVLESTEVKFIRNRARNGGAISLLYSSVLELHPESQVVFDSNSASESGGAIYATIAHPSEYLLSQRCFIRHHGINGTLPYSTDKFDIDIWNISLQHSNNSAVHGDYIFTDSFSPCLRHISEIVNASLSVDELKSFVRRQYKPSEIATSPAIINFTLPAHISPGEVIDLNLTALDDLDHDIPSSFKVLLESDGAISTAPFISYDGRMQLHGEPGTYFNLTLQTQSTRHVIVTKSGRLESCPLGFILVNSSTCVCSANIPDREYTGIAGCDSNNFQALLQVGYWVGCIEDSVTVTGLCPVGFCKSQKSLFVPIPRTCEHLMKSNLFCAEHRKGVLCSECEDGYSPYYHSDTFHCGKCSYGALGILAYFASEIVPLFVVFVLTMSVKFKVTSAFAQSFIFFSQIIFILNLIPSFRPLSETSYTFIRIHSFIVGFFSMFFFHLDELSFCLWEGATILDLVTFRYVTTSFIVIFLTSFIVVNHKFVKVKFSMLSCSCPVKIQRAIDKMDFLKNSVVHGITTFLIISYTQYTFTSFVILSSAALFQEGGTRKKFVVYLHESVDYFGVDHLPYAIPAILVLVFLSLPPPLLLISYPLLWKIKAKLRRNVETENDTTVWPICKLLPLIDSFQGVFKDNCRMFAGLLFLWRVILLAIALFTDDVMEFFFATEIVLLAILIIHTLVRPYKESYSNIIDGLMLANMAVIVLLKWFISLSSTVDISPSAIDLLIFIQLFLMYIPLIALMLVCVYWLLRKMNVIPKCLKSEEEESNTTVNDTVNNKGRESDVDDILFSRAAELNTLSSAVTCTEVGVELENGN